MDHLAYCRGIDLPGEALDCIRQSAITEAEYAGLKGLFYRDIPAFQQRVLSYKDWRQRLLYLYTRLASETWEEYQQRGIPEKVFWDTYSDQKIWYGNCLRMFGEPGLAEYDWLWLPMRFLLFRLGRLQFIPKALEKPLSLEHIKLPAGAVVLDTHIAQGEPLDMDAVHDSFGQALRFFRGVYPVFVCHSWLINPVLQDILPATSRIVQFQKLFTAFDIDDNERQTEERIFGRLLDHPAGYPEETSLQRSVKQYLLAGNKLGVAWGAYCPKQGINTAV